MDLYPTRLLCSWDFPGKNTGLGCHFLLQEIFLIQGSNLHLLRCRQILYQGPPGKPSVPLKGRRILGTWAGLPGGVTGDSSVETESPHQSSDFMPRNYSWLPPIQETDSHWCPWSRGPPSKSSVKSLALAASSEPQWVLKGMLSGFSEVEFPDS